MSIEISGKTRLIALFGDPVSHSKSPAMQNASFSALGLDYVYLAFRVPAGCAEEAVRSARTLGMPGFNVTMPLKQEVMSCLDGLDLSAELCGAVNTVVNKEGFLTGYNTDAAGAVYAVRKMGVDIPAAKAVILGLGGAGKAVFAGLASAGCRCFTLAIREPEKAGETGSRAHEHAAFAEKMGSRFAGLCCRIIDINDPGAVGPAIREADLLINATNLGMGKNEGISPVKDSSCFHSGLNVMDAVYDPAETEFLRSARAAGVKNAVNGLDMLLGQGIEAFRLFTGEEMPPDTARQALGL